MLERARKPRTEVAHFAGPAQKLQELREYAAKLGCHEVEADVSWRDAFVEFQSGEEWRGVSP